MDKVAFREFLTTAKANGATASDVADVIKQASGAEIDPRELEALMAQLPQEQQQGGGGQGHHQQVQPPHHVQHSSHSGHPHEDPSQQQLDPSQIDPLQGGAGQGAEGMPLSEEQINQIAQIVVQHLQEQEAQGGAGADLQGLPPEHQQGLDMAKTSEYIGEFIKRASEYGISPDDGVNIYCSYLDRSINTLKAAAEHNKEVEKFASNIDVDILAYWQGVAEKAASENMTYEQTLDLLKKQGADKTLKEKFTNNK